MPILTDNATVTIGTNVYNADVTHWTFDYNIDRLHITGERQPTFKSGPVTYHGTVTFITGNNDSPFNYFFWARYTNKTMGINYCGRNYAVVPTGYNAEPRMGGDYMYTVNFYGHQIDVSPTPCQPNHSGPPVMKPMNNTDLEELLGHERFTSAYKRIGELLDSETKIIPHKDPAKDLAAVLMGHRPFALIDPALMSVMDEVLILFQLCLIPRKNKTATFTFNHRSVMAVGDEQLLKEVTYASNEPRFIEHLAHLYGLGPVERDEFVAIHDPKGFNWVAVA